MGRVTPRGVQGFFFHLSFHILHLTSEFPPSYMDTNLTFAAERTCPLPTCLNLLSFNQTHAKLLLPKYLVAGSTAGNCWSFRSQAEEA